MERNWRKQLKLKSNVSLGLPICIDPIKAGNAIERNADPKSIAYCMDYSRKLKIADTKSHQKFEDWQQRVKKFYNRSLWGESEKDVNFSAEPRIRKMDEPVLPSNKSWHYFYHGGKTRAERRREAMHRIDDMKKEHNRKLEERKTVHKDRISKFAKLGMDRRSVRVSKTKKTQEEDLDNEVDAEIEYEAQGEAALRIQNVIRGHQARQVVMGMKEEDAY